MAVSCLTTAQTDPYLVMEIMRVIRENTDYPNGLTCKVWKAIQDLMTPSNQYSRLDMLEDMQKIKLKTNQDPRQLGIAMEHFLSKYTDAPDAKHIVAVVQQCGRDARYGASIDNYIDTMKMCAHRKPTARELIKKMKNLYRMNSRTKKSDKADPE